MCVERLIKFFAHSVETSKIFTNFVFHSQIHHSRKKLKLLTQVKNWRQKNSVFKLLNVDRELNLHIWSETAENVSLILFFYTYKKYFSQYLFLRLKCRTAALCCDCHSPRTQLNFSSQQLRKDWTIFCFMKFHETFFFRVWRCSGCLFLVFIVVVKALSRELR